MKTKLLHYALCMLLTVACQEKELLLNQEPEYKPAGIMTTPSSVAIINEPDTGWDGDYCATISINDLEEKSISSENLIIKVAKGYLKEIKNEDRTVIQDFKDVFFNEDGYTEFQTHGKEYRINIKASQEDCFSGELKGFSVQCNGKTQKGKRCKNKTLSGKYCWHHRE
ncbi:hypothetical protein [Flavobacterium cerinum]|uniref:Lipoprotein n=1 Tax=Flavobacterium cerinum TaxID=2502784 RepID=A0ABY5IMK8_9FLAO|nr:hypothetical protein [Flavobacterium cerinum]UUC43859.1 hypothetical protein NOX80_09460 [Flavobacterium cerinum]